MLGVASGCTPARDELIVARPSPRELVIMPIGCRGADELDWVRVTRDKGPTLWEIEIVDGKAPRPERFTLGEVPPGYREVVPFDPDGLDPDGTVAVDLEPAYFRSSVKLSVVPSDGRPFVIEGSDVARPLPGSERGLVAAAADDCAAERAKQQRDSALVFAASVALVGGFVAFVIWQERRARRRRIASLPPPPSGPPGAPVP